MTLFQSDVHSYVVGQVYQALCHRVAKALAFVFDGGCTVTPVMRDGFYTNEIELVVAERRFRIRVDELVEQWEAWTERPPIQARCGCRVDFLAIGPDEYAFTLTECALGDSCPVVRWVWWEIDRTREAFALMAGDVE